MWLISLTTIAIISHNDKYSREFDRHKAATTDSLNDSIRLPARQGKQGAGIVRLHAMCNRDEDQI